MLHFGDLGCWDRAVGSPGGQADPAKVFDEVTGCLVSELYAHPRQLS